MDGMENIMKFGEEIFSGGLIAFLIQAVLTYVVLTFIKRMIVGSIRKAAEVRGEEANTPLRFLARTISTCFNILILFLILRNIVPLSGIGNTLLGATSVLAIIYGIAAQEAFGNLIAGFFLAVYQPFRIGDQVSISSEGVTGNVAEINMRHTVIRTFDNTRIIIPNSRMGSAVIEDRRIEEGYFSRLIQVSVAYDTDIDFAKKVINDAVSALPDFIDTRTGTQRVQNDPAVNVVVTEFQDSGIQLSFRVNATSAASAYVYSGQVREAVLKAFRENGIVIPYPTRTVEIQS